MVSLHLFEWIGTIFALSGAFLMASNKLKPHYSYIIWILSNIFYIYFFLNTGNNGLLTMNVVGIMINLFGMYQWSHKEINGNKHLTKILLIISILLFIGSIYSFFCFLDGFQLKNLEWTGSLLGLCSAFLLSARHKYSFLCWFLWSIANGILIFVGYQNSQFGFVILQVGFMISNVYGGIVWAKDFMRQHKLVPIDEPTHG